MATQHPEDEESEQAATGGGADDATHRWFRADLGLLADPDTDSDGHRREWQRVYQHFTPRLDAFFRGRVPEDADRADLVQHIWERAVLNVRRLPSSDVLWNWLRTVGENRLTDARRAAAVDRRRVEGYAAAAREALQTEPPPTALDALASDPFDDRGVDPRRLGEQLAQLPDRDRRLLQMVADGVSHDEIARALALSNAAASRQQLARVRRRLRASDAAS